MGSPQTGKKSSFSPEAYPMGGGPENHMVLGARVQGAAFQEPPPWPMSSPWSFPGNQASHTWPCANLASSLPWGQVCRLLPLVPPECPLCCSHTPSVHERSILETDAPVCASCLCKMRSTSAPCYFTSVALGAYALTIVVELPLHTVSSGSQTAA